jgi:two-component system sensor histidine kinase PilS (NtrC family)
VIGTLLLGSAILIQISRPGAFPVDPFFALIGLTYALSVLYLATLRFAERHPWLVDLQFGADAVLVSAFIHVTGGIASNYSSLYLLPVIAASMIRSRRVALQVAGLSTMLYLALVLVQYVDVGLPPVVKRFTPVVELPTLGIARYTVAINLSGFFAVALLAGSLAESLRSAGARLEYASHEIRDLRKFNENVINSLLSGLVTADADGRILTFNRAAATILGIPSAQAIRHDAIDVLQLPRDTRARLASLGDTRTFKIDTQHRTGDGRSIDLGLTVSPLTLSDRRAGFLFTFQDVTDVRRLERNARLQQRLAAVGEMAAGIAHEIRNPLASMSGSIQVLRQELTLNDEQAQLMDIVLRESERLNDTIKSFLAYARPQRFALARLDVRKVVQDAALLLRNSSEVHEHHTIAVDVPDDPVWCEADENQIRQVLWNLATNGLKAMAQGGRLLLTAATAKDGSGATLLTVQDQGRGIPAEDLDVIFQPFHSSFDKGTGLGLAIVHRIVTDYNGTINVSSRVGAGTVVTVRLPIRGTSTVIDSSTRDAAGSSTPRRLAPSHVKGEAQKAIV